MITLTLLHPLKNTPVQSWSFEQDTVIRMGRATDNHVVLYSAVVSRRHVELRRSGSNWEVVSLGANGTYVDGERISRLPVVDGLTIRLARSGPTIQICLGVPANQSPALIPPEPQPVQAAQPVEVAPIEVPPHSQTLINLKPVEAELGLGERNNNAGVTPAPPVTSVEVSLPPDVGLKRTTPMPDVAPELLSQPSATSSVNPISVAQPEDEIISFSLVTGQPLQVKQTIGRYQIVKTLFQGSTSISYLAWRDGRSLVLKTLNANWVGYAEACSQLEKEARILHQLRHPGIPQLIDFFWVDGQPYLAREMIYGQDLARLVLSQGPIPQPQAISWIMQVCDVLNYLHQQRPPILHYDLKPSNLIRRATPQGSWEIGVVGLKTGASLHEGGTQMEFPAYVAPEQQEGQPIAASDLYSLGAILVFLITGQEPLKFYQYTGQDYRLAVESVPDLSPNLTTVLRNLTQPKPELRYSSAKEVSRALQQAL